MKIGYLVERAINYYQRRLSYCSGRDMCEARNPHPFISFTFDDFPRSAAKMGGRVLSKYGLRGSYYASLGLMGEESPVGKIFLIEDLEELISNGHEIGCHTYDHLDAWETSPFRFYESIIRNAEAMVSMFPGMSLKTLSYPKRLPHPKIKRMAGKMFDCCRGGGQVFNAGRFDRNLLKSCFIDYKNRDDIQFLKQLIDQNTQVKGWLIFSTHDVSENPSLFGCKPEMFEDIVKYGFNSGSVILPIKEIYENIQANSS